jgi:hypothetical protein
MAEIIPSLSIITLNVNVLTFLMKKTEIAEWNQFCALYKRHFIFRDTNRLKVKRMKKDIPCRWPSEESRGSVNKDSHKKTNKTNTRVRMWLK